MSEEEIDKAFACLASVVNGKDKKSFSTSKIKSQRTLSKMEIEAKKVTPIDNEPVGSNMRGIDLLESISSISGFSANRYIKAKDVTTVNTCNEPSRADMLGKSIVDIIREGLRSITSIKYAAGRKAMKTPLEDEDDVTDQGDDTYYNEMMARQSVFTEVLAINKHVCVMATIVNRQVNENNEPCPDWEKISHEELAFVQKSLEISKNNINKEANQGNLLERVMQICDEAISICSLFTWLSNSMSTENRESQVMEAVTRMNTLRENTRALDVEARIMSDVNSLMDYQPPDFKSVIHYFSNGLNKFAAFVENLQTTFQRRQNDTSYIKNELLPLVENSKVEFDSMMACTDGILQEVNHYLEACVSNMQWQNDRIKRIDGDLASLKTEFEGKEKKIRDAEHQYDRKNKELSDAESALSTARRKLTEAENDQKAAVYGGAGTAIACTFAALVFPPALIGAVGGLALEVAGVTAFEDAKNECDNRVDTARHGVSSSRCSLDEARQSKESIRRQLSKLQDKRRNTESGMRENQIKKQNLETYQEGIIDINEKIKLLYSKLCAFYGTCKVVHHETEGGYSIAMLESPTLALCDSLSSVLQCAAICDSCSQSQLELMKLQLHQIESCRWPAIAYEENVNDFI